MIRVAAHASLVFGEWHDLEQQAAGLFEDGGLQPALLGRGELPKHVLCDKLTRVGPADATSESPHLIRAHRCVRRDRGGGTVVGARVSLSATPKWRSRVQEDLG